MNILQRQFEALEKRLPALRNGSLPIISPKDGETSTERDLDVAISTVSSSTPLIPQDPSHSRRATVTERTLFHGTTSSNYGIEKAKSSLQSMAISPEAVTDDARGSDAFVNAATPLETTPPVAYSMDASWNISHAEALRLVQKYEDECGVLYPIFDIERVLSHIRQHYGLSTLEKGERRQSLSDADHDRNVTQLVMSIGLLLDKGGDSEIARLMFKDTEERTCLLLLHPPTLYSVSLQILMVRSNHLRYPTSDSFLKLTMLLGDLSFPC